MNWISFIGWPRSLSFVTKLPPCKETKAMRAFVYSVCFQISHLQYATPKVTIYQRCNFIVQIHKFTIKIDTISINLLFECVKVVEFNFSSHLFLVMYQDIRIVNQDAFFFKSRRGTTVLIISVSERGWKREHKLEFKMASDRFWYSKCKWIFRRFDLPFAALRGLRESCSYH